MTDRNETMENSRLDGTENTGVTHASPAGDAPAEIRGRWRKGQSGNPGGRPRGEREVRELAQMEGAACIRRLRKLARSPNERVALAANVALLDRGYGRPNVTVSGPNGQSLFPAVPMGGVIATAEEGERFLREYMFNPSMDVSNITFAPLTPSPPVEAHVDAPAKPLGGPAATYVDPFPPDDGADTTRKTWEVLAK